MSDTSEIGFEEYASNIFGPHVNRLRTTETTTSTSSSATGSRQIPEVYLRQLNYDNFNKNFGATQKSIENNTFSYKYLPRRAPSPDEDGAAAADDYVENCIICLTQFEVEIFVR